ncbi:pectin lyase fold/virulence factor [Flagelloscypha sp. PMI_526]|nr:pectin lyase fold/virulence factor [Flagelloscypha sp. PMI_526]
MTAVKTILGLLFAATLVSSQLSGRIGPTTTYSQKAKVKICDATDYGAKADGQTDDGPSIQDAWNDCSDGGLVYIPPGNYFLSTFLVFHSADDIAVQLDGTLIRDPNVGGYSVIEFRNIHNFEFFSGNSKGFLQGNGHIGLADGNYGPRMVRFQDIGNFSVHGIAVVDSPSYYFVFDNVANGEVYNLILRGVTDIGATDAIDLGGSNIWVHDVEVSNGDECVTVKSPSHNLLIESIYCNLSGGTAIGSLGTGTNVTDVHYQRLYLNRADGSYLKTNNGDGIVKNILWENVIVHGGPYPLTVNEAWGDDRGSTGVQVSNLTFRNWRGEGADNSRPVIRLECDADVPCSGITIDDVQLWTAESDETYVIYKCANSYGSGGCLRKSTGTLSTYTSVVTVTSKPTQTAARMPHDWTTDLPYSSFTHPAIPTTFFPGATPSSKLLSLSGPAGTVVRREAVSMPVPTV